jgi:hypothetical protein
MVDKTRFKLYIPKLRVPKPIPTRVRVVIYLPGDEHPELSSVKYYDATCSPEQLQSPIVAKMRYISPHTDTIRYDPIGNSKEWETGSPYIPTSLLPAEIPAELTISVEWLAD